MDRSSDSQASRPAKPQQDAQPVKVVPPSYRSLYLILYNSVSALLWAVVLGRVIAIESVHGRRGVYPGVGQWTKWTQTVAALEVVHAVLGKLRNASSLIPPCTPDGRREEKRRRIANEERELKLGIVRAPILTTLMQVASRFLLVWLIVPNFPATTSQSTAYGTMLLAWSVTEVIRYSYFAVSIAYGRVPKALVWLRYNTFFVLYPLGIASECWLVWSSIEPARSWNAAYEWALRLILFVYVPGASAPSDGSLKDVRPSLTTWSLTSDFAGSHSVHLVTSFVTWLPTATAIRTTVDPRTASSSAAARISEELGAALSSMAADAGGQGGPTGKCIGDCPDKGQAVGSDLPLAFMLATVGMILGLLLVF
ncbi:hypothetical protein D0863_15280 [Hortaea werneckii]|uniref:Very-long-chain (3R)-3-hydroxyacyl-CoA dehydratase n=1 Tax=Hortaea werneckii TaxID=91943 RepID=A0A3M7CAN8_HORWE|nr:hypothetical protein D0863_15280 [Hortaea werneckii]